MLFVSILSFSLAFVSCSKDDEEKNGGKFTYNNVTYNLDKGQTIYVGEEEPNIYEHNVVLLSKDINVNLSSGEPVSGIGDFMIFDLYSSSPTSIEPMTYTSAGTLGAGSVGFGAFVINMNVQTQSYDFIRYIKDINLEVEKSGDRYMIDINATDMNGMNVTGRYEGPLDYFVESNFKMKLK